MNRSLLGLVLLSIGLTSGCGGPPPGPARFELSGKATFGGKPIPRGTISFSPDTTSGNKGPGTVALIRDGQYKTEPDKGTVGGPHEVRIFGFDGDANVDSADGKPLFPEYRMQSDLPKESGKTVDFDVPTKISPP